MRTLSRGLVMVCILLVFGGVSRGEDLTELSLEALMDVEVTSVSKREEKFFEAAAAIYVITAEDIRRSGAESIPEALRMVPGLHVARIDANKWAISARGFTFRLADKMLVLIDGRSVYTPLFAGVYWNVQDTLMEDIERIEVIRGPGATLWGANAVNGVINIITKSAKDTQGGLLTGTIGTYEHGLGGFRYGGKLGKDAWFRIYTKYFNRDRYPGGADDWRVMRGGFRLDWDTTEQDSLTFQGDIYDGDAGQRLTLSGFLTPPYSHTFDDDIAIRGGNVLARWRHTFSKRSDMSLQFYYDRMERNEAVLDDTRDTVDLDFQHRFGLGERHDVIWGLGYRYTSDRIGNSFTFTLDPQSRGDHLVNAFVQDEITLIEDRLNLTLGSKFEHNDYTGFEVQPSMRLAWTPNEQHTVWGSISRAVRSPSRVDDDMRLNFAAFPGPMGSVRMMSLFGNRDFKSEELIAYELGYRIRPTKNLSLNLTTFYNVYDQLQTHEPGVPFFEGSPPPPHMVIPLRIANKMDGESYGVELGANCKVTDFWKLRAGYTWLQVQLHRDHASGDTTSEGIEGDSPHHQVNLRSYLDLPGNWEFDTALYYVDSLPNQETHSYVQLDVRLGWRPKKNIELSVGVKNVLWDRHREFGMASGIHPTEVPPMVYGKFTWRF